MLESAEKYAVVSCVKGSRTIQLSEEKQCRNQVKGECHSLFWGELFQYYGEARKRTERDRWDCVQWGRLAAAGAQSSLWFLTWKRSWKQVGSFSNYPSKENLSWGEVFTTADLKVDGKVPDDKERQLFIHYSCRFDPLSFSPALVLLNSFKFFVDISVPRPKPVCTHFATRQRCMLF